MYETEKLIAGIPRSIYTISTIPQRNELLMPMSMRHTKDNERWLKQELDFSAAYFV